MMPGRFRTRLPCATAPTEPFAGRVLVLHHGHHPTVHYYWRPRFPDVACIDTATTRARPVVSDQFSLIVIVRHITRDWLQQLSRDKSGLPRITYFTDDDIPGITLDGWLPMRYVIKTRIRYLRALPLLDRVCDEVCVSTDALAQRYGLPGNTVLAPLPNSDDLPRQCAGTLPPFLTVFYHGTGSHIREARWLRPVIEQVTAQSPETRFELIGGKRLAGYFEGIEQVSVIPQMSWSDYRQHARESSLDIGLAPLLPSRFNAVRSHVKWFDITHAGAPGIYADRPPFDNVIRDRENGLLADETTDSWIAAINELSDNLALRQRIVGNSVAEMKAQIRDRASIHVR